MKTLLYKILIFSTLTFGIINKEEITSSNNCASESRIVTLMIVDFYGLNLDDTEDATFALETYKELYLDCYANLN